MTVIAITNIPNGVWAKVVIDAALVAFPDIKEAYDTLDTPDTTRAESVHEEMVVYIRTHAKIIGFDYQRHIDDSSKYAIEKRRSVDEFIKFSDIYNEV